MIVCVHSLQKRNAAQSARRLCGREIVIALHTHTAESCMLLIFWIIHQHTRLTANSGSRKTSLLFLYFSSRVCRELTRPMQTQCEWNSSVRALHGGYILLTRAHIWLSNEPDRLRQFSQWSGALADFLEQSVSRQIRENAQKKSTALRAPHFLMTEDYSGFHILSARASTDVWNSHKRFSQDCDAHKGVVKSKKGMRFLCAILTFCVEWEKDGDKK